MKLTILVDNNTYIDQYYWGEPAFSCLLEDGEERILFDAGYSHILLDNADKLGIDLSTLTRIVLSHGHDDHTRGLKFLLEKFDLSQVPLTAHPHCFLPKRSGELSIGSPYSEEEIARLTRYQPQSGPLPLSEHLTFLGEIPRLLDFEPSYAMGQRLKDGRWEADFLPEDSALVYHTDEGIFLITGCSHSGVCNMVEYAKKVCKDDRVLGVLGGFHLFQDDDRSQNTIQYLAEQNISQFYPCHCVSLKVKAKMAQALPVTEVGVGLTLEL